MGIPRQVFVEIYFEKKEGEKRKFFSHVQCHQLWSTLEVEVLRQIVKILQKCDTVYYLKLSGLPDLIPKFCDIYESLRKIVEPHITDQRVKVIELGRKPERSEALFQTITKPLERWIKQKDKRPFCLFGTCLIGNEVIMKAYFELDGKKQFIDRSFNLELEKEFISFNRHFLKIPLVDKLLFLQTELISADQATMNIFTEIKALFKRILPKMFGIEITKETKTVLTLGTELTGDEPEEYEMFELDHGQPESD